MSPTLQELVAIDFATAQTDWDMTISFQTPTVSTSDSGTETESLSSVTEVEGFWQPWREQHSNQFEQLISGLEGLPEFIAFVPLDTSVAIGDVATYLTETGEVMAIDRQPGHKGLILKERK
jgi:hypothetical protein